MAIAGGDIADVRDHDGRRRGDGVAASATLLATRSLSLAQQIGQLGDVGGDPSRLIEVRQQGSTQRHCHKSVSQKRLERLTVGVSPLM